MSVKKHVLPHGTIYVNMGTRVETVIIKNDYITLKPKQAKFVGFVRPSEFAMYFASVNLWEAADKIRGAIESQGLAHVALDCSTIDRLGDQLMLTVVPLAFDDTYGDKVEVSVICPAEFKRVWQDHPHVKQVFESGAALPAGTIVTSMANVELKCATLDGERRPLRNRTALYLEQFGLFAINKRPTYAIANEDLDRAVAWLDAKFPAWAEAWSDAKNRLVVGVAAESLAMARTYPHMAEVKTLLAKAGCVVVPLDDKDAAGRHELDLPTMAAVMLFCDVVLTNDSAALHLAGALQKESVSVHGSTLGEIMCDSYEKATTVQGKCQFGEPCFWKLSCVPATGDYMTKAAHAQVACLDIDPHVVADAVLERLRAKRPRVLACMLTYNLLEWTKIAKRSIRSKYDVDVFVVDNESTDGTRAWLQQKGIEHVALRTSVAGACNVGVDKFLAGDYDYFLLLNNDICLRYDTIDKLVAKAEELGGASEIFGLTAAEAENTPFFNVDEAELKSENVELIVDIPASAYSCTLFTRRCIEAVGKFDERFTPRYIEDNDYTLRIRLAKGAFMKYWGSVFYHVLGGVVQSNEAEKRSSDVNWKKNIALYKDKWGILPHDHQDLSKVAKGFHEADIYTAHRVTPANDFSVAVKRMMGGAGDHVFLSIVPKVVKAEFPGAKTIVIAPKKFHEVYLGMPFVDVVTDDVKTRASFVVDCTDLDYKEEMAELRRYGKIIRTRAEIYLDAFGLPKKDITPTYVPTAVDREFGRGVWRSHNRPKVAVSLYASNVFNTWPHAMRFIELLTEDGCDVVLLDGKSGDGKFMYSFSQAAGIVACADFVVAPNSGFANLAGAIGTPVIMLSGYRDGRQFSRMFPSMTVVQGVCPQGKPFCEYDPTCYHGADFREKEQKGTAPCLKALKPETVFDAVLKALKK